MRAVIIGAGRVGLGCAADLCARAGLEVTVLGRGPVVHDLNLHGAAAVTVTDGPSARTHLVPLTAIDLELDRERAVAAIAVADLVCTAVGPTHLLDLGEILAAGLEAAAGPVDVVAFENLEDAGQLLRDAVGAAGQRHGFSGAVVDRVVARRELAGPDRPVRVVTEETCEVVVETGALHRDWSLLPGVRSTEDFGAAFQAKLHRYSAGHATAAYLGMLKGYRFVHAAVADPEIAAAVLGAMEEGRQGLLHRYGPAVAGSYADVVATLARFGNAGLGDTTERVGRDVPRKVARDDRLVGAARDARKAGTAPVHLSLAVAAALHVENPEPPRRRSRRHLAVSELTGLRPGHPIVERVAREWAELEGVTTLLSLKDGLVASEAMTEVAA